MHRQHADHFQKKKKTNFVGLNLLYKWNDADMQVLSTCE
jgi:hypothetical protein